MSHNDDDVTRSARHHRPAIIAIILALVVAVIAYVVFRPGTNEQGEGIATTPPPAGVTSGEAAGTEGDATGAISPEDAAPTGTVAD